MARGRPECRPAGPAARGRTALLSALFPRSSRDAEAQSSALEEERSRPAARGPSRLSAPRPFDGRARDPRELRAPGGGRGRGHALSAAPPAGTGRDYLFDSVTGARRWI